MGDVSTKRNCAAAAALARTSLCAAGSQPGPRDAALTALCTRATRKARDHCWRRARLPGIAALEDEAMTVLRHRVTGSPSSAQSCGRLRASEGFILAERRFGNRMNSGAFRRLMRASGTSAMVWRQSARHGGVDLVINSNT